MPLFHRHARGLILTEQGELLYRTAHEVFVEARHARGEADRSRETAEGRSRSPPPSPSASALADAAHPRVRRPLSRHPDQPRRRRRGARPRHARGRRRDPHAPPRQPDLVQRQLFTVHYHVYASPEYLKRFGTPRSHEDLDKHHLLVLGGQVPSCRAKHALARRRRPQRQGPRTPAILTINNVIGILRACQSRARHRHAAGLHRRRGRRAGAAPGRVPRRSRSTPISSIPRNSSRLHGCRRSATFWSARRSAGIIDRPAAAGH